MSKVCIIVGHGKSKSGGYDSGAVSKDGKYHEFKIAREIAAYASLSLGICDIINYDGDSYLTERIAKVNASDYDLIVEVHLNAGGGTGTEAYFANGSAQGARLAENISSKVSEALGIRNRGAKIKLNSSGKDYFGIIRQTKAEAVLVETAFIDNEGDLNKIKTKENMRKCGAAIAEAIRELYSMEDQHLYKLDGGVDFKVKVVCMALTVRKGPGTGNTPMGYLKNADVVRIDKVNKDGTWGRLKGTEGWISLNGKYVGRV